MDYWRRRIEFALEGVGAGSVRVLERPAAAELYVRPPRNTANARARVHRILAVARIPTIGEQGAMVRVDATMAPPAVARSEVGP